MKRPTYTKHNSREEHVTTPEQFLHKKSLGQNFLTSEVVPRWLTEAGEVTAADIVLEIGPGTGALTRTLLATGATVIALEADARAITILQETFASEITHGTLQLHHYDARELSVSQLGLKDHQFKVVANIPYYLSGFLLRTLLETDIQPSVLVFLMQKEVVQRIARDPKESLLSLSVKAFGTPKYIKAVSRGHFNPPPKVDSAILQIIDITHSNFRTSDERTRFFNLLHLGFGQKRKQLLSNLTKICNREQLTQIFQTCNLPLDSRAETLSLQTWLQLFAELSTINTLSPGK